MEEEVARTILDEIRDGDAEAELEVQFAKEEVKLAREVLVQKLEEVKQALQVAHHKVYELKKCRTAAAARKQFGILQQYAVKDTQEADFLEACEKIVKTREAIDEAVQK